MKDSIMRTEYATILAAILLEEDSRLIDFKIALRNHEWFNRRREEFFCMNAKISDFMHKP